MKKTIIISLVVISATVFSADIWVSNIRGKFDGNGTKNAPFKKLSNALKVVKSGDVINIEEGIYREHLELKNQKFDNEITIKGASGTPVISGFNIVNNWQHMGDNIYKASLNFRPMVVRLGGKVQPISRYPESGWLEVTAISDNVIVGKKNDADLSDSTCYLWAQKGNLFWDIPITNFNTTSGHITLDKEKRNIPINSNDRFFCFNKLSFIRNNGDWAWRKNAKEYELYIKANSLEALKDTEVSGARPALSFRQVSNVRIENLIFEGSNLNGINLFDTEKIVIQKVGSYLNKNAGIFFRKSKNITVKNANSLINLFGIICYNNSDVLIQNCDVGYNAEDGVVVSWNSDNVMIKQNYIHHQTWWGHPDNMQVYRTVTNLTIDSNLFFSSFQGLMTQELENLTFKNNIMFGGGANLLILGHKNANNAEVKNNTILAPGYASGSLTGKNYSVYNNIFEGGINCYALYEFDDKTNYKGDNNIFVLNEDKSKIAKYNNVFYTDLEKYKEAINCETNSKAGIFEFKSRPPFMAVINAKKIFDCTSEKIYLRRETKNFKEGDIIEIFFDGVPRKITSVKGTEITFTPKLKYKPMKDYIIANWKNNSTLKFNLSSDDIKSSGSNIDFESYRMADFNKDGKRDNLDYPSFVNNYIEHKDLVTTLRTK